MARLTLNANGSFSYTPTGGYTGPDAFTYHANDGTDDSNTATVSLTVGALAGPVGQWLADEGSGSVLVDSSGQGNDGALQGNPTWVAGQQALAIRLDGTGDYAVVPDDASLDISGPITIAAWVRPETTGTQYLVKKATQGGTDGYELSLASSGKVFFRLNQKTSANTYRIDSTTSYPADGTTWMHVAATYDGTTMRLYINGVQDGSVAGPASIVTNALGLGIGAQPDGVSQLQGALDDIRLYGRALSAAEIAGTCRAPGRQHGPRRGRRQLHHAPGHGQDRRGARSAGQRLRRRQRSAHRGAGHRCQPWHPGPERERQLQLHAGRWLHRPRHLHVPRERRDRRLEHRHRVPDRGCPRGPGRPVAGRRRQWHDPGRQLRTGQRRRAAGQPDVGRRSAGARHPSRRHRRLRRGARRRLARHQRTHHHRGLGPPREGRPPSTSSRRPPRVAPTATSCRWRAAARSSSASTRRPAPTPTASTPPPRIRPTAPPGCTSPPPTTARPCVSTSTASRTARSQVPRPSSPTLSGWASAPSRTASQLQGSLDDIRLYGRALSAAEILALAAPPPPNAAPNAPTLNAPANADTGIGTSPTLDVGVSDPDADPLTVTYFGRPLASGNFVQIAQHTDVASGTSDSMSWPGIGAGQTFEWYVTVKDPTHTAVTGPTWTFHTVERRPGVRGRG